MLTNKEKAFLEYIKGTSFRKMNPRNRFYVMEAFEATYVCKFAELQDAYIEVKSTLWNMNFLYYKTIVNFILGKLT